MIWCFDGMKRKAVVPPPHPVTALHHASSVSRHRFKALTYSALVFSAAVPSLQDSELGFVSSTRHRRLAGDSCARFPGHWPLAYPSSRALGDAMELRLGG